MNESIGGPGGGLDDCDPWFHFVYDTRWRIVAVYRVLHWKDGGGWTFDDDPKERFVYHNAGLDGYGGSSYIDAVILRDRDANTPWPDEADGTLEERVYYCQNWRADVVALFNSSGHMLQQVRYDPYGVPFGISKADINADGVLDSADSSLFVTLYNSGSGTHPFADWNLDGTLNSQDLIAFGNSYNADAALGYGVLSYDFTRAGGANRKGYAGYELAPELSSAKPCLYHVRHRVYDASMGRWTRRDPLGYVDGANLYGFVRSRPLVGIDPFGLATTPGGGGGGGCGGSRCNGIDDPPPQPQRPDLIRPGPWDKLPHEDRKEFCKKLAEYWASHYGIPPTDPCYSTFINSFVSTCIHGPMDSDGHIETYPRKDAVAAYKKCAHAWPPKLTPPDTWVECWTDCFAQCYNSIPLIWLLCPVDYLELLPTACVFNCLVKRDFKSCVRKCLKGVLKNVVGPVTAPPCIAAVAGCGFVCVVGCGDRWVY